MTAYFLALWLQALPVRPCPRSTALAVARVAMRVARRHHISPKLLGAAACLETWGRKDVVNVNKNGSCDIGRWQVNCPRCSPQCFERYLPDHRNAGRAAVILAAGKGVCRRLPKVWYCPKRWYCRFNPGSREWCSAMTKMWRE